MGAGAAIGTQLCLLLKLRSSAFTLLMGKGWWELSQTIFAADWLPLICVSPCRQGRAQEDRELA